MGIHQFLLLRKSGELVLSASPTRSSIEPSLIAGFISAISLFSKEMVGYNIDIIATKTHKFLIDDITENLLATVLIDEEESIIDVKRKIDLIKKYIKESHPNLDNSSSIPFKEITNIKDKIIEILTTSSSLKIDDSVTGKLRDIINQIIRYDEIDGVLVMDEGCKELASVNLDDENKFVIQKQLENLYVFPSIYAPTKVIFLTKYGVVVSIHKKKFIAAATTSNKAYMGIALSILENNIDKIEAILV